MNESTQLAIVLSLKDELSGKISGVKSKIGSIEPVFKKMAVAGTAAFAGIATGAAYAIREASNFETAMANVSTLLDTNMENMDEMKMHVLNLSKELPVPINELTASLYDIRSAGISADQAMLALNWSAKLAKAGLSTTQEATNILTSALNSFKAEGISTKETSDILFKTVKAGKTTISELAISFGASAPVIADAGVKLADFQAATAALTTTGLPASQAQMGLRQAIVALTKPTGDMEKLFKNLGMTGREMIGEYDNMGEVFQTLKATADDQNVSWEKAIGSVEALNAVTGILGSTSETYTSVLADMLSETDAIDDAYAKQAETFAAQKQQMINQVQALVISIGTQLMPILQQLIEKVTPIITAISDWISKNPELTGNIIMVAGAAAGLVAVMGTLGVIIAGISTASIVVVAVLAAIGGAAYLLYEAWTNNWGGIHEKTQAVISGIVNFYNEYLVPWWAKSKADLQKLKDFWQAIWDNIKTIFSGVWQAIVGVFQIAWGILSGLIKVGIDIFTGNWKKAWEDVKNIFENVFKGIYNIGAGIFKSIIGALAAMVNGAIKTLNKLIDAANHVKGVDIGHISSVKTSDLMSYIPTLAVGTNLVPEDMLAYIHKGEAVVPREYNPAAGGRAGNIYNTFNPTIIVQNEADEDRLIEKMKNALSREQELADWGMA